MSFTEKFSGLMSLNQQPGPLDDQPLYIRYGVRLLAILGAFLCVVFGLLNTVLSFVTLNVYCVVGSILQIVVGFVVLALEASCCFVYIEHVNQAANWMQEKPLWYKAGLYCAIVILPLSMCFGLSSLFSYALIFASGVIYGMMALGKKASVEEMRQTARNSGYLGTNNSRNTTAAALSASAATLPSNDRADIISNAQPFSFTGAVGTDSNV